MVEGEASDEDEQSREVWVTWDCDDGVGYIRLTDIADGEASIQRIVTHPDGHGEVILDFNREGVLLGIEFLGLHAMPASLRSNE